MGLSVANGGGACMGAGAMVVADMAGVAVEIAAAAAKEELGGKAWVVVRLGLGKLLLYS